MIKRKWLQNYPIFVKQIHKKKKNNPYHKSEDVSTIIGGTIKNYDLPVANSRGKNLPCEQALKAASTTKGTASMMSHAGSIGLT